MVVDGLHLIRFVVVDGFEVVDLTVGRVVGLVHRGVELGVDLAVRFVGLVVGFGVDLVLAVGEVSLSVLLPLVVPVGLAGVGDVTTCLAGVGDVTTCLAGVGDVTTSFGRGVTTSVGS